LVWKRCAMVLERGANAVLQGRLHQSTHGHDHEKCHHAFRLFEIQRRGQQLRVIQKTAPTLCLTLAFIGVEERLRRPLLVVKRMGGQNTTTLLDAPSLSSGQGGRQSAFNLGDHPRG
jgi:hypothetical protein